MVIPTPEFQNPIQKEIPSKKLYSKKSFLIPPAPSFQTLYPKKIAIIGFLIPPHPSLCPSIPSMPMQNFVKNILPVPQSPFSKKKILKFRCLTLLATSPNSMFQLESNGQRWEQRRNHERRRDKKQRWGEKEKRCEDMSRCERQGYCDKGYCSKFDVQKLNPDAYKRIIIEFSVFAWRIPKFFAKMCWLEVIYWKILHPIVFASIA